MNRARSRSEKDRASPGGALPRAHELLAGRGEALDTAKGMEDTREAGGCHLLAGPTFRGSFYVLAWLG